MKKNLFKSLFVFALVALVVTGCGSSETKKLHCTLSSNDAVNKYTLESTYNAYYKGSVVEKVETEEKITTDVKDTLDAFAQTYETTYKTMNDTYGGYTYDIAKDNNVLTIKVTIDYNKVDVAKLVKDQPALKQSVNSDNKLLVSNLKATYEAMGATCKYE